MGISVWNVKMLILVFWVATPFGLGSRYKRFGGTYCLHIHQYDPEYEGSMFLQNTGIYP
jgi:hypothetical protein